MAAPKPAPHYDAEWFKNAKKGDPVIIVDKHEGKPEEYRLSTVQHDDEKYVWVIRYHKRDSGHLVGFPGEEFGQFLARPTPELIAKAEQQDLARLLESVNFRAVGLDKLKQIASILGIEGKPE